MTAELGAWHPEAVLAGAVAAVLALAIGRTRPTWACDLAAAGVVAWLLIDGQIPAAVAGWTLVIIVACHRDGTIGLTASMIGVVGLAWCRPASPASLLLVLVPAIVIVATTRSSAWRAAPALAAGLIGAALAGTFAGGPDTEGAVAAGAALIPVLGLSAGRAVWSPTNAATRTLTPSVVLVVWLCVDAYRGRPGGLPAAAVAVAAAWATTEVARRFGATPWTIARILAVVVTVAVATVGAGRTMGLERDQEVRSWMIAAALVAIIAIVTLVASPRGSARTPPA